MREDTISFGTSLRPWREVARLYTERTGRKMTVANAFDCHTNAMRKLRKNIGQIMSEIENPVFFATDEHR